MSDAYGDELPAPHTTAVRVPWWKRKATLILLTLLAALAVFATTTQTWIHVSINPGQVATSDLFIPGSKAAVAVSALALVAAAGVLATTIAGKIARIATCVIVFLSAVGIIAVVLGIMADPGAAAMAEAGVATGLEGKPENVTLTMFPALAGIAAAIMALGALWLLWVGRGWSVRTKYDTGKRAPASAKDTPLDQIDSWDSLSRGEDPTN